MNESIVTFLFELGNFVLLAGVLGWLFFKPVRAALQRQRQHLQDEIDQAAAQQEEARRLLAQVDSQRRALTGELEQMREAAVEQAQQEAEALLAEARKRINRKLEAVHRAAIHVQETHAAQIAAVVAETTEATLRKLLDQIRGPDLDNALLNAACREVNRWHGRDVVPVTVEAAAPLSYEAVSRVAASLGCEPHAIEVRIRPELRGGLRIITAVGLVDASAAGLAEFAEQALRARLQSMLTEAPAEAGKLAAEDATDGGEPPANESSNAASNAEPAARASDSARNDSAHE